MRAIAIVVSTVVLSGCATFSEDGGFGLVQRTVKERTGQEPRWARTDEDAGAIRARTREILGRPLSADDAVQVALLNNHVWVGELEGEPRFRAWLEENGLTFDEAVRIQGPGPGPGSPDPAKPSADPAPSSGWDGPGDSPRQVGSGASSPSGSGPGAGSSTPLGTPTLASPTTPTSTPDSSEDWLQWWEANKLRWLESGLRAAREVDATD